MGELALVDKVLEHRLTSVPVKFLEKNYTHVAGGDPSEIENPLDLSYRIMGTTWIAPWGAIVTQLVPPTSVNGTKYVLTIPQSRARHFLTDVSVYITRDSSVDGRLDHVSGDGGLSRHVLRLDKAVLRRGSTDVMQALDSNFAVDLSYFYKRGVMAENTVQHNNLQQSTIITGPLLIEAPLRALPLFYQNTLLPEIEYEISGLQPNDKVEFIAEFITSPGETLEAKPVIQNFPSFKTFVKDGIELHEGASATIAVPVSCESLVRCVYIRLTDTLNPERSCDQEVESTDVLDDKGQTLVGKPLPGLVTEKHLKSRFGFSAGDKATRVKYTDLPWHVIPFAAIPCGGNPDYGVLLTEGSVVKVAICTPRETKSYRVEIALEYFKEVRWQKV